MQQLILLLIALPFVSAVLTLMVSLGFLMGTVLRRPMVAAVILIFLWYPLSLVLHTFSLEEFSPVSLDQALPTLLRRTAPWGNNEAAMARETARKTSQFLDTFRATNPDGTPEWYREGDYEDCSVCDVLLGYGLPALAAVGLSLVAFCWRDL